MTDELDLVRRFRPDEPDAGDETITAARAALTRAIAAAVAAPSPLRRRHATARGACVAPSSPAGSPSL